MTRSGIVATMAAHCIICDYDLHGLDPAGNCPECGTPIERSLKGDLLRYADQSWLTRVHLGMRLITFAMWGVAAAIAIFIAGVVIEAIADMREYTALAAAIEYSFLPIQGCWLLAICCLLAGLWLATTLEPREASRATMRPVLLRWTSLAVLPVLAVWMLSSSKAAAIPVWTQIAIAMVGFVLLVAHMTLFCDFMQAIDRRCAEADEKRRKMLKRYRSQGLGCAALLLLLVAISVGPRLFSGRTVDLGGLLAILIVWLAIIGFAQGAAKRIRTERAAASAVASTSSSPPMR